MNNGEKIYKIIEDLFPINRSLTGEGVRETLNYIKKQIPVEIKEVDSGYKAFDWTVPKEWKVNDAYIANSKGEKIIDFKKLNLHLMGYSIPIDKKMYLDELEKHLYSIKEIPDAVPYITSYYSPNWGFCLSHNKRQTLEDDIYSVKIDSEHFNGVMNYGEMLIKGESEEEILLSTYVCHPSMVNNELSGPAVLTYIVKWLLNRENKYSYRILFAPETIGSIVYINKNLENLKKNLKAGMVLTCLAKDSHYSYVATKYGDSYIDNIMEKESEISKNIKKYSFLDRGSDERQYNSANVDLPVIAFSREKFGEYKEYHNSNDDLSITSPEILNDSFEMVKKIINSIEKNNFTKLKSNRKAVNKALKIKVCCEPQLGKRGLYPNISTTKTKELVQDMMNIIAYSDGTNTDNQIMKYANINKDKFSEIVSKLFDADIIERIEVENV